MVYRHSVQCLRYIELMLNSILSQCTMSKIHRDDAESHIGTVHNVLDTKQRDDTMLNGILSGCTLS